MPVEIDDVRSHLQKMVEDWSTVEKMIDSGEIVKKRGGYVITNGTTLELVKSFVVAMTATKDGGLLVQLKGPPKRVLALFSSGQTAPEP